MNKTHLLKVLTEIRKFKAQTGIEIVDTHIHPYDVMGVVHYSDISGNKTHKDYLEPNLLEYFGYGQTAIVGTKAYCKFLPGNVEKMIYESYENVPPKEIENAMSESLVDKGVLLSLDPWAPSDIVGGAFTNNDKFYILASVDIHQEKKDAIEKKLTEYIKNYGIKGLKLHPNLQGFKPQPKDNPPEIGEKLKIIYRVASEKGLYILFHGGLSDFTEKVNGKYESSYPRSRQNGALENFCDENGRSELFENYTMPIVIAHMGHYGKIFHNYELLKLLVNRYNNIHFDTAGVSPYFMTKAFSFIPSTRIVFGSDAMYNKMAYDLAFLYESVLKASNGEKKTDMLINVLHNNFHSKLIK
ncbi:MAG: amidohydrolase family protein [Candidatus Paceibacterota bacterium]|jgi:predicted TIM-barrel fold metal-dependent hydrolase